MELECILRENVEGLRLRLSNSPDSAFPFKRPTSFNPPGRAHVPLSRIEAPEPELDDEMAMYREEIRRAAHAREQQDARDESRARRRAKVSDQWREHKSQFAASLGDENDLDSEDDMEISQSEAWVPNWGVEPWHLGGKKKRSEADVSVAPPDPAPRLLHLRLASSLGPEDEASAPVAKKRRPAKRGPARWAGTADGEVFPDDEATGKSVEATGKSVEASGKSVEATGKSVEAPGKSAEATAKSVRVRKKKKTNAEGGEAEPAGKTTARRPTATVGVRPARHPAATATMTDVRGVWARKAAELEAAKKRVAEAEKVAMEVTMELFLSSRASLLPAAHTIAAPPPGSIALPGMRPAVNMASLISLDTSDEPPALIDAEELPEPPATESFAGKLGGPGMDFFKDVERLPDMRDMRDMLQFDPMADFQYASEDKFMESIFQSGGSLF